MRYRFEKIENGTIEEGYTSIQVRDHEVEIDPANTEAILLAEKRGGELVPPAKKRKDEGGSK